MVHAGGSGNATAEVIEPLLDNDLRWYCENIATDFYSTYHRWSGDRPVNWKFREAKKRYRDNLLDPTVFIREPSLSDPEWLHKVRDRLIRVVNTLHPYQPLYYNLADEPGTADLSAFWDFDLSEHSLAAMREWLKERYGSVAALNQQWSSKFDGWGQVTPMTTQDAIRRSDWNFSAWADFKEWMDVAFARAIENGSQAIHAADPEAVAAIEGAQIPGWGGYDYSRLASILDAMELYDFGDKIEIVRSFNPKLIMLLTSPARGTREEHRVWRETLRGIRGLILWDEKNEFVDEDGNLGNRGRETAAFFAELRGGLGALLINSRRHADPIGVYYSPASMRVQWLLDRRTSGEDWTSRNASSEYEDDAIRTATRNFVRLLEHRGLQPRFVSSEQVGRGALRNFDYRILMLPHTIAMSPGDAKEISDFIENGGIVISDREPGIFDEHGRRLTKSLLSEVFAGPPTGAVTTFGFGKGQAVYAAFSGGLGQEDGGHIIEILTAAGVQPDFPLARSDGGPASDVETYIFENGSIAIIALLRDYPEPPVTLERRSESIVLGLPQPVNIYDIRAKRALGRTDRLALELDPVEPVVLALTENPLASPSISGPQSVQLGANAEFTIRTDAAPAVNMVHVDTIDPEGKTVAHYSGNLLVNAGKATKLVPFALNDQPGLWMIRVNDLLSGKAMMAELRVEP